MADDRGVGEQVERLGRERAQRRQREGEDLAVVGARALLTRRQTYDGRGVKLRLYHHRDGARVAYREAGTGPPLALLHSAMLSHKEFEPIVELLADRFRVVLPDLPLHGDSEERPRHPYTPDWFAEVHRRLQQRGARPAPDDRRPRARRRDRCCDASRASRSPPRG